MKIAFTVCNRYQLPHALVLADSVKKHSPDRKLFLGWVDRMAAPKLPDWVSVVPVESLEVTDWTDMERRYYDFELVAASKPFFARHLLAAFPVCEELAFLSPTTQLFASLDLVADKAAFLQLSPQRLRPIGELDGRSVAPLEDKRVLNTGMYNSGSWIMHPDSQEIALLNWWCERMIDRGFLDLCEGMCLDQLWLNYLPIYYERVKSIRNPGWHHGLPSVVGSKFTQVDGSFFVDDVALISLDFSGIESHLPVWSDHTEMIENHELWSQLRQIYRNALQDYSFLNDLVNVPYGKSAPVKSNRNLRKRAVRLLGRLIDKIDRFDLTY